MPYELNIILKNDFYQIIDQNYKEFVKDFNEYNRILICYEKMENLFESEITKYLKYYILFVKYEMIEYFFKKYTKEKIDRESFPYFTDSFKFNKVLNENTSFIEQSRQYGMLFKEIYDISLNIIKSTIIKKLYIIKNEDKIKNNSLNEKFKEYMHMSINDMFKNINNYNNNNIEDRIKINLPIPLIYILCDNSLFKNLEVCINKYSLDSFYNNYIHYYYQEHLYNKINNDYYILFNLIYLIKYNPELCNVNKLLDKNKIEDLAQELSINIFNYKPSNDFSLLDHSKFEFKYNNTKGQFLDIFYIYYSKNLKSYIENCIDRFIILNISIFKIDVSHSNILIYNPKKKEVEIFEPSHFIKKNDFIFSELIPKLFPPYVKYIHQQDYITKNIQVLQETETCSSITGYCTSWSLWYASKRLKHPDKNAADAFQIIYDEFLKHRIDKKELTKYIQEFTNLIIAERKFILKNHKLPPNVVKLLMDHWFPDGLR